MTQGHLAGKQVPEIDPQHLHEEKQLAIGNAPQSQFLFASECRLMDQPSNCSLLAMVSCDQSRLSRWVAMAGLLLGGTIGLAKLVPVQDTFPSLDLTTLADSCGVLSLSGTNIASFQSWSDAQLTSLAGVLDATPTISASALPRGGMGIACWSLQNPKLPPLPGDTIGVDIWLMSDGNALLSDLKRMINRLTGSSTD